MQFHRKEAEIINMSKSLMMYHFCYHGDIIVIAVFFLFFFQYIIVNKRLYLYLNTFIFAKTSRDQAYAMTRVQHT